MVFSQTQSCPLTADRIFCIPAPAHGEPDAEGAREICPAPIPDEMAKQVQDASRKIYFRLGCKGVVRMDYICAEDGLYFLEVNTIPGMTQASLVPKMVRTAGMDMSSFLSTLIENS